VDFVGRVRSSGLWDIGAYEFVSVAPILTLPASVQVFVDTPLAILITATDPDNDIVTAIVTSDNGTGSVTIQGSEVVT
jgi:hypothetical protein